MSEIQDWVTAASAELGIDSGDVPVTVVLDLARDVAHQVLRPGAPVTAFLMGLAVGRGADPSTTAERLSALAASWPPRPAAESRPKPGDAAAEGRPEAGVGLADGRSGHDDPPIP